MLPRLEYIKQAKSIDQEFNMVLVTPTERYTQANVLIKLLRVKFKEIPDKYVHKIKYADVTSIDKWSVNFVFANSLEEVFNK